MEFELDINCNIQNFFKVLTNFEELPKYLPSQLQKLEVLEKKENNILLEATLFFKTLIKKEISQKIQITKIGKENLLIEVMDGHAKNTKIKISSMSETEKSKIKVETDLKLSLKAKILSPIIKREYKFLLTGVFRKMEDGAKKMEVM